MSKGLRGQEVRGCVTESLCLKETFHEDEGHEAEQEGVGSLLLIAVGVSLGYHLVAGDIEHGTTGKAEHEGEHELRGSTHGKTQPYANDLKESDDGGDKEGACMANTRHQEGSNDHHALGHVLQGYAQRDSPTAIGSLAHAHAGCHAFGQFVKGNGHDKEQDMVERSIVVVLSLIQTRDMVEVGCHQVQEIEEEGTHHDTNGHEPPVSRHFEGRNDETDGRGCQHDASTISEYGIIPLMRQFLNHKAYQTADYRGTA